MADKRVIIEEEDSENKVFIKERNTDPKSTSTPLPAKQKKNDQEEEITRPYIPTPYQTEIQDDQQWGGVHGCRGRR